MPTHPGGSVRATAFLAAVTANTSDVGREVSRVRLGDPVPVADDDAPTAPIPSMAITVRFWSYRDLPRVDVTVAAVRTLGACAAQISASPAPVLALLTRFHLSPAPLTVAVCLPA